MESLMSNRIFDSALSAVRELTDADLDLITGGEGGEGGGGDAGGGDGGGGTGGGGDGGGGGSQEAGICPSGECCSICNT
jgi:hypothetical protein